MTQAALPNPSAAPGPFPNKITDSTNRQVADYAASSLPAGIYRLHIEGVDMLAPDSIS